MINLFVCSCLSVLAPFAQEAVEAPVPQDVQEITVTLNRTERTGQIDRRIYDIRTQSDRETLMSGEAIIRLPGVVRTTNDKISVFGDTSVIYMLDDKYIDESIAQRIPASELERIEVVTNPSAAQGGAGGVRIILVTRKKKRPPTTTINVQADSRERVRLSSSIVYDGDKWGLWNTTSLEKNVQQSGSRNDYREKSGRFQSTSQSDYEQETRRYDVLLFPIYKLSPDRAVSFGLSANGGQTESLSLSQQSEQLSGGLLRDINQRGWSDGQNKSASLIFNYSNKRSEHDRESYNLQLTHANRESLNESRGFRTFSGRDETDRQGFRASVEASRQSEEKIFKAGLNLNGEETAERRLRNGLRLDFDYADFKAYGYVTYQFKWGDFTILPGLGIDYTRFTFDQALPGLKDREVTRALPSLHIQRSLGKRSQLSFSYSRKTGDENIFDLSNFDPRIRQTGVQSYWVGNPDLKIPHRQTFELLYETSNQDHSLTLMAFDRTIRNSVRSFSVLYTPEPGALLSRPQNFHTTQTRGLDLTWKYSGIDRLVATFNLNASEVRYQAETPIRSYRVKGQTVNAKINLDYRLSDADSLYLSLQRDGKTYGLTSVQTPPQSVSLKYTRQLDPRTSISVDALDFLAKTRRITRQETDQYVSESNTLLQTRRVQVTLSRRF